MRNGRLQAAPTLLFLLSLMPDFLFGWRPVATAVAVLLTTMSLRPAPFGGEVPAPPTARPAAPDTTSAAVPRRAYVAPAVAPDYFLFPIKPGKQNFLAGSMGEIRQIGRAHV